MNETDLVVARERTAVEYYEEDVPVRGCKLSMEHIKNVYLELDKINREFGAVVVASLVPEEGLSEQQWQARKKFLFEDSFRLTTTITGDRDQRIYGEDESIFSSENLPSNIRSIYFTNITAFKRNAGSNHPRNSIEVILDFGKPDLTDASPLVSEQTPNNSEVVVRAEDISFFRAVRQVIDTKLASRRSKFGFLHVNFAYDFGLWFLALPIVLLLSTYYLDLAVPKASPFESYRWAIFIYAVGLGLIGYRVLNGYAKWAFPVNILMDNKDTAWKHRLTLGGVTTWIFYKVVDVLYGLVAF